MPEKQIHPRLPEELVTQLEAYCQYHGVPQRLVVEQALEAYFDPNIMSKDDYLYWQGLIVRRLDAMQEQYQGIRQDLELLGETVAMLARMLLTLLPLSVERDDQTTRRGGELYRRWVNAVAARTQLGQSFVHEVRAGYKDEEHPYADANRAPQ